MQEALLQGVQFRARFRNSALSRAQGRRVAEGLDCPEVFSKSLVESRDGQSRDGVLFGVC